MSIDFQEPPQKSNATKIIAIIAGIVLVLMLGCGIGVFFLVRAVSPILSSAMEMAQNFQTIMLVSEDFLEDIAAGKPETAYQRTSSTYQERTSLDEFKKFLDANPAVKNHTTHSFGALNNTNGITKVQGFLMGPNGQQTSCTIELVLEEDYWRISKFTVP